jgi:GNAT superfamily N-acetyltransferase
MQSLGNGLVLRSLSDGFANDLERLPDFHADWNGEGIDDLAKAGLRGWMRQLTTRHVNVRPADCFVVVDTQHDDQIVAATHLIPQTWQYCGIPVRVGRPELVATHPDYRGRGLIRALFEAVHARSAALGHQLLGITGIPSFYRQFGYTMAVGLDDHAFFALYPLPMPDENTRFGLRPATLDDIPTLQACQAYVAQSRVLADSFTPEDWVYEVVGRESGHSAHAEYLMITDKQNADTAIGYVILRDTLLDPYDLRCVGFVVGAESSYLATFEDVMRSLKAWATAKYGACPHNVRFYPGIDPALDMLIGRSYAGGVTGRDYAWYLRVPEPEAFLRHIAPALERRLSGSGAHRYTGRLRVGFATLSGVEITFEDGRLLSVERMQGKDGYDAEFPNHSFWNVVFGHRTIDELEYVLPDVWATPKATVLLGALFPKHPSFVNGMC